MDDSTLRRVSAHERALYAELLGVYRELLGAVDDAAADPARLVRGRLRADELTRELRAVRDALASERLTGSAVPEDVRATWQASAALAVDALAVNAELAKRARASHAATGAALARVEQGRAGLAGYRPAGVSRTHIADTRA
jgi:hypothetical protein